MPGEPGPPGAIGDTGPVGLEGPEVRTLHKYYLEIYSAVVQW